MGTKVVEKWKPEGTREEDVILCNESKNSLFSSARLSANRNLLTRVLLIEMTLIKCKVQHLLSRRQNLGLRIILRVRKFLARFFDRS